MSTVDECMRLARKVSMGIGETELEQAIVAYGDAQWNAAIREVDAILMTELGNRTSGSRITPDVASQVWAAISGILAAIRGLKR